ncbi:MFS transporter [Spirulina sp. CS-785/01]|uniref:MFS transporter n=1 Tax=Spirulina sp. CS-785/01 TaxID=3021716 RepID=UPI00232D046E|nr:MFS transporter [Spirulina sp. CS-785/01]MDB9314183.1 MFS transporter [Spirulina sp. CS-785/01]
MTKPEIGWWRVGGITAIQGAITLCWVIYNLYLPVLLVQWGFSQQLAGLLLIIENALEAVIEPLAGDVSDRTQRFLGTRLPFILAGVILASALFIALPALVILGSPETVIRGLLPIVAVVWAVAMAIFRSPALSLLSKASPQVKFPLAASGLTFIQQLAGSLRFTAYGFILSLGAPFAFALGTGVLLAASAFLRWVTPPEAPSLDSPREQYSFSWAVLPFLIGTALGLAWGLRFLMPTIAGSLNPFLGEQTPWGMFAFSVAIAIMAFPAGKLATHLGNRKAMLIGIGAIAILIHLLVYSPLLIVVTLSAILLSFAFSLVLNGSIPFVLNLVPTQRAGLGIGCYFGAFGAAMSLFDGLILPQDEITISLRATLSAIAFLIAGGFIAGSHPIQTQTPTP